MKKLIFCCAIPCSALLFAQPIATYGQCAGTSPEATRLKIIESELTVQGRSSSVYKIVLDNGQEFLQKQETDCFNVIVENHLTVPTSLHWHGVILPNLEDGVSYVTQAPIGPGQAYPYNFKIVQSGSYFAHAHYGLQEQKLMNIPMIFLAKEQQTFEDVIACFEDFTFQSLESVWQGLRQHYQDQPATSDQMPAMQMRPDLNDVSFDAYLCNRATLEKPPVRLVKAGEEVRLRLINAATASGFLVTLAGLHGTLIAVDGQPIEPIDFETFSLATAQRMDVIVHIPQEGGAFPILAQGQGTDKITGLVLKTEDAPIPELGMQTGHTIGAITNDFEKKLRALNPLQPKAVDRVVTVELGGNMQQYIWSINQHVWPDIQPLKVKEGERVQMVFINNTAMSHPMHLHGHIFQVMEIEGEKFSGAMRDTILVMPYQTVKVQFDANNPGIWALHCHIAYHAWAGMFTEIHYEGVDQPLFPASEILQYSRIYGGY